MRAVLVALALAAGGCGFCWAHDEACVEEPAGRCVETPVYECLDGEVEPLQGEPVCANGLRYGSCVSHGYSRSCGGYWVRPGSPC